MKDRRKLTSWSAGGACLVGVWVDYPPPWLAQHTNVVVLRVHPVVAGVLGAALEQLQHGTTAAEVQRELGGATRTLVSAAAAWTHESFARIARDSCPGSMRAHLALRPLLYR